MTAGYEAEAAAILAGFFPGLAYLPGPTIRGFLASGGRRDLLRAPNQTGKTLAGAKRADLWSLANPGSVLGVLVADLANHYPELCAKIAQVITAPMLDPATVYVEGKGYFLHGRHGLLYRNGTRWLFRSGSGPLQGLEGFSADAGWVDEVPERGHYGAFTRGVHGPLWVTMTPIGRDPRWFRARVETDPDTGAPSLEDWRQFVPELSVRECPWLRPSDIAERHAKTDPFEAPQRLRGEWEGPSPDRRLTAMSGANVLDSVPLGDWRVTVSADHGEGAGHEHVVLLFHDDARIVVVDEYRNATPTDPTADARGVVAMLARARVPWQRVDHWWGDVNSAGKLRPGHSVNEELRKAMAALLGVRPEAMPFWRTPSKGAGSVDHGARLLNIALAQGELLCCKRAAGTLRALWSYSGPDDDEGSHAIDALRYGAVPVLTDRRRPSARHLYLGME